MKKENELQYQTAIILFEVCESVPEGLGSVCGNARNHLSGNNEI